MTVSTDHRSMTFQAQYHLRWNHLTDPHVRTLAWLLDAPDLLDANAASWQGRVATLGPVSETIAHWLAEVDRQPAALHACLGVGPFTRLGRYAENLMAFYLNHIGTLYAHGIQVRAAKNATIGEFDFLVRHGEALFHWEFATKLYLLESSGNGHHADSFVGPNLADTLGAKITKIMDQQLALSRHPAAQQYLPQPIAGAQALVKGWLFYHGQTPPTNSPDGISRSHCRGFWRALEELDDLDADHYIVLPRLEWLAPAKSSAAKAISKPALKRYLTDYFTANTTPALIALLKPDGNDLLEEDRGFIVPGDWRSRAGIRVSGNTGPALD